MSEPEYSFRVKGAGEYQERLRHFWSIYLTGSLKA
jgi:hypothetical protein